MAKHNWFFSLLTVAVSQSKEERRAGDLPGRAGTCWRGWGQGGGGRWQAGSQTVVVLGKDLTPTLPYPTTREQGWGFLCGLEPRCMVFQSHHADLFPSLLYLSTCTSQRG